MALGTLNVHIQGVMPLIMHNAQLADPTNQYVRAIKAITAKGKKKTDADYLELKRLEFMGGIYYREDIGVYIPSTNIDAMIHGGAKKSRQGIDALTGVFSESDAPLIYSGPKTPEELFERPEFVDTRAAGVQKAKVMRTRPIFNHWEMKFTVRFEDDVTNDRNVMKWIEEAGRLVGLCDFRPKYGRFEVL